MAVSVAFHVCLSEWWDMRCISSRQLAWWLGGLLAAMLVCAQATAGVVMHARVIELPGVKLQNVRLTLDSNAGKPPHLTLSAESADVSMLGWHHVGLHLGGTLQHSGPQNWSLNAQVKLKHAPGGLLSNGTLMAQIDGDTNTLALDVSQGRAKLSTALPADALTHAQIHLTALPLRWLQGLLAHAWHGGQLKGGRISGTMALDVLDDGIQTSGTFRVAKAAFDSTSGTLAGQGLTGSGHVHVDTSATPTLIDLDSRLHGGQILLGSLYATLPSSAVQLSLHARSAHGAVDLRRVDFTDPGALTVKGSLRFASGGALQRLQLDHVSATFPAAYEHYGKAWLKTKGVGDLKIHGSIDGSLSMTPAGLSAFRFDARNMDLADAAGDLRVRDLDGGLNWSRGGTRKPTTLGWKALKFHAIPNGAAKAHLQSRNGELTLLQPLTVPVLGGQWSISALSWRPAASKGQRLDTSMTLSGINLPALCRALGWPEFPGTLAGAMPGLSYRNGAFDLDGGLSMNAFHGFVDITSMTLQHPFGDTPVLAANMHMSHMDLKSMTSVFDFGSITGHMHGTVSKLRLVGWKPVAFDASLTADEGGRISQEAVNNLTSVGGGGVAAGLQGMMLKLFHSFGYSRIQLTCRLTGSVCHMGGIKPVDNGYLIVEGNGLPHLSVIGHQRDVSWPILISRLKAATSGKGPVVK